MPLPKNGIRPGTDVTGRALQWEDLSKQGRDHVAEQMDSLGRNMTTNVADHVSALKAKETAGTGSVKERRLREALEALAPHARNRPVTVSGAASRRQQYYERGVQANHDAGQSGAPGAGWYYEHHRDIQGMARSTGFDTVRAITASAVMSPQNSPEAEKIAVSALMKGHADGKVNMTPELHARLQAEHAPVDPAHVGSMVAFRDLHPATQAALSLSSVRHHVDTNVDLDAVARGGTKENIAKAARVLSGDLPVEHAIDPHTAAKVWSYHRNIVQSVPDTAEHHEYMSRVAHHADVVSGRRHPGERMLDLWGLRGSTAGQLSGQGHTAEDTWMNSISHGQPNVIPVNKTNVMKTLGSAAGVGALSNNTTQHAFNNRATRLAGERMSRGHDFALPSTAAQEVSWTQARREAGKDSAWNNRAPAPQRKTKQPKQLELF